MDISKLVQKYKTENKNGLWEKSGAVITSKSGKWDRGIDGQSQELTQMLIYEYATSLECITNGKLSADYVLDKLSKTLGTLRLGDFREGQDDNIKYDNMPVTSEEYKQNCRIKKHFGAHQVDYEEDGKHLYSVVMYDGKQKYKTSDGQIHTLSGGNLDNLDDIRQTLFHEWTHVMEKCLVKASELTRNDIIQTRGDSIYINGAVSSDWTMEEYKAYIENVDKMLQEQDEILFNGISTVEINERKSPDKRIMHNQISEGATELISRKIMEHLGRPFEDGRYGMQANFAEKVFASLGIDEGIATYLTLSNKIISYIESKNYDGRDILRDSDKFITALGNFEGTIRNMTEKAGNRFGPDFDRVKKDMMDFWKQGKNPQKEDIEKFYESIDSFANVPESEQAYVRSMINFALAYPRREKNFYKELDILFPKERFSLEQKQSREDSEGPSLDD